MAASTLSQCHPQKNSHLRWVTLLVVGLLAMSACSDATTTVTTAAEEAPSYASGDLERQGGLYDKWWKSKIGNPGFDEVCWFWGGDEFHVTREFDIVGGAKKLAFPSRNSDGGFTCVFYRPDSWPPADHPCYIPAEGTEDGTLTNRYVAADEMDDAAGSEQYADCEYLPATITLSATE